jgi:hypothetical protein
VVSKADKKYRPVQEILGMLQKFTKLRLILVLQFCIILLFTAGCGSLGSIDAGMGKTGSAAPTQQSGEAPALSSDEAGGEVSFQSDTEITNEPAATVSVKNDNQSTKQEFQNKSSRSGSQTTAVSTCKPSTQATNGGKNLIYSTMPLGSNVMPIGAWVAPPPANALPKLNNPDYINKDTYRDIKESGINIIYALYESFPDRRVDIMRALDAAKANGIKYLVRDSNIMGGIDEIEMLESAVELYKNHTAFAGHNIQDEPGMNTFENYKYLHENYKKVLPDKLFYINLLPTYSTAAQRERGASASGSGKANYNDYLNSYLKNVNPKVISYDYYPLSGSFPKLDSGYYENMSIIRKRSMEKGIPFWVFIQSCSFGSGTRTPTEPEIQWQVNTALAYGAKGIQYFTYWTPLDQHARLGSRWRSEVGDGRLGRFERCARSLLVGADADAGGTE